MQLGVEILKSGQISKYFFELRVLYKLFFSLTVCYVVWIAFTRFATLSSTKEDRRGGAELRQQRC